jgi:hypothetical protein
MATCGNASGILGTTIMVSWALNGVFTGGDPIAEHE